MNDTRNKGLTAGVILGCLAAIGIGLTMAVAISTAYPKPKGMGQGAMVGAVRGGGIGLAIGGVMVLLRKSSSNSHQPEAKRERTPAKVPAADPEVDRMFDVARAADGTVTCPACNRRYHPRAELDHLTCLSCRADLYLA